MGSSIYTVTIDCADPDALASFWERVLDYRRTFDEDDEVVIEPRDGGGNALLFIKVPDPKVVKNRIHLDLASRSANRDEELERLLSLGATEVEDLRGIHGPGTGWVVLADPEGNEFCIVRSRAEMAAG